MIPDPENRETFLRSKLNWGEIDDSQHARMQAWYRDLIHLRRSTASLNDGEPGNIRVIFDEASRWLTLRRRDIQAHCNLGSGHHVFPVEKGATVILASRAGFEIRNSAILLPPDSIAILKSHADSVDKLTPCSS
jgi:maltooligosyltrehalose trehalohydrolase